MLQIQIIILRVKELLETKTGCSLIAKNVNAILRIEKAIAKLRKNNEFELAECFENIVEKLKDFDLKGIVYDVENIEGEGIEDKTKRKLMAETITRIQLDGNIKPG